MEPKKPTVLVAGFPRCGSTFFYHLLKQHPEIHIPDLKEINYFNKDHFFMGEPEVLNPRYFKPKKWYYQFFRTNKEAIIDFSILSAYDLQSALRVKHELGDVKILFITRDKEKFLCSVRSMLAEWREYPKNVERYAEFEYYIEHYKRHFSNVCVTSVEKINKGGQKELDRITKFIGVKKHEFNFDTLKHDTASNQGIGFFQFARRKLYVGLSRVFFFFSSLNVMSMAIAEKPNHSQR